MKKPNKLINRRRLISLMKAEGIVRVNTKALDEIEKQIEDKIKGIIEELEESLKIKGRKTLLNKDIVKIFEKKPHEYPEI